MFKTIKWNTGSAATRFRRTRKAIQENRKKNKAASSQAGGPARKESGHKLKVLTTEEYKILWDKYS